MESRHKEITLLDSISKSNQNIHITNKWSNGLFGAIIDIENNCIYRFVEYNLVGDSPRQKYLTEEEELSCPIIACGIIAFWIKHRKMLGIKQLFKKYYELRLNQYEIEHEKDDDAWTRNLKEEFILKHCIIQEKDLIKRSIPIFNYLSASDINKIKNISNNFLCFVRAKRKEIIVKSYPQDKVIQNTFFAAYSHGGAYHCIDWFREEYNLPPTSPDNDAGIQGAYHLEGEWKSRHEVDIPEIVQEEYDDFDDSVLIYSNGGLMNEIHHILEKCNSTDDRIRYITSLLQPFESFSKAFYANSDISQLKNNIQQNKAHKESWLKIPDGTVDQQTGQPLDPQKQIEACDWFINRDKKQIEYLKLVESKFYEFAQKGLKKEFEPTENQSMFISLGTWWSLMITFSRRLAALALTYGIKLMDVQEQCGIYLNWYYEKADYLDYEYISTFEQVNNLLAKIETPKGSKNNEYEIISNIIYEYLSALEKLPPNDLDEVSLRNQTVSMLLSHGYNATAESYNGKGKTDILIKNNSGDNLFIGECKIWHGEQKLQEAIDQLFNRYVTWRDTNATLIVFVENGDFTNIIAKAKAAVSNHPLFISFTEDGSSRNKESYFSSILRHSDDSDRQINLNVMLFHFPKKHKERATNKLL